MKTSMPDYRFYRTVHNGSEKLIKTSQYSCVVLVQTSDESYLRDVFAAPYPDHEGEPLEEITEQYFVAAFMKSRSRWENVKTY